jgi:uncharacterized protein (TIGR02145 family)
MKTTEVLTGKRATARVAPTRSGRNDNNKNGRTHRCAPTLALVFFFCANLHAQVTSGGLDPPQMGAVLDLNAANKGGLLLSNVSLTDLTKIPAEFPGIIVDVNDGNNPGFKGAIVYNTNPDTGMGVYVWTGTQWIPAGTSILYDAEGNDYTIGNFGEAGTWMTQNLRSTQTVQGGDMKTVTLYISGAISNTSILYHYPDMNTSILTTHPEYGLSYTWAAANIGVEPTNEDPNPVNRQGICPTGWHLPNADEWVALESVISASVLGEYSETTSTGIAGTKVKSKKKVDKTPEPEATGGTSLPREEGGFDALLVGSGNTGYGYGSYAYFWSSSCNDSKGINRNLYTGYAGVGLGTNTAKNNLYSVRCKKD